MLTKTQSIHIVTTMEGVKRLHAAGCMKVISLECNLGKFTKKNTQYVVNKVVPVNRLLSLSEYKWHNYNKNYFGSILRTFSL